MFTVRVCLGIDWNKVNLVMVLFISMGKLLIVLILGYYIYRMGNSFKYIIELVVILINIVYWDGLIESLVDFNCVIFIRIIIYNGIIISYNVIKLRKEELVYNRKYYI